MTGSMLETWRQTSFQLGVAEIWEVPAIFMTAVRPAVSGGRYYDRPPHGNPLPIARFAQAPSGDHHGLIKHFAQNFAWLLKKKKNTL